MDLFNKTLRDQDMRSDRTSTGEISSLIFSRMLCLGNVRVDRIVEAQVVIYCVSLVQFIGSCSTVQW